jgi:hypothetical protein
MWLTVDSQLKWVWPRQKSGLAMHTVSESGTAFAGPAGPSMPSIIEVSKYNINLLPVSSINWRW